MNPRLQTTLPLLVALSLFTPLPIHAEDSPAPKKMSDSETSAAIQADIQDASRIAGGEINVTSQAGLVTLSGTANSLLDKQMAGAIAKRTRGVEAILNQLIVIASDRGDDDILADVDKVLRINDSVDQPRIAVDVSRGEVSMTGKVDSLAEKRIAELAASGVSGVTAVNNQITVSLAIDRTDEEIAEEIRGLMVHSVYLDDASVQVDVQDNVAKLSGTVPSVEAKDRAEQVAEIWGVSVVDVSGLKIDPDRLDESQRLQRYADVADEKIVKALDRSFRADPIMFSRVESIQSSVDGGVVTLTGRVNRLRTKSRAERLTADIVGVQRVVNEIRVEYVDEEVSDMEIIHDTQAAIRRNALLDRHDIRVHCQRAHVSLYGIVDSELEKSVAQWLADGVKGVVHVNNSLAIEPEWKEKDDATIKSDLQRKLKYALFDKSNNIDVTVENGTVILRGEVATWRQWQLVMDLAFEAGARHPHNLLNVRFHPPHGASRVFVPR